MVILKVTDKGNGIDRETLKKIYDPFFTTKSEFKGTGLGLTISNNILNYMGGAL